MKAAVILAVVACAQPARAQTVVAPYSIGVEIMQPPGCPVFITTVLPHSPAESAGLRPGDRVLRVDGAKVRENADAARLLRGSGPDKVRVTVRRGAADYQAAIIRENIADIFAKDGRRIVDGVVVPAAFSGTWISARVFPRGYPLDLTIYYPGFEALIVPDAGRSTIDGLVVRGRLAVVVGEVPPQGPAGKAGLEPGDIITAVNGEALKGQSAEQLRQMLSTREPATIHLDVQRGSDALSFDVPLETATQVAAENGRRIVNSVPMPAWLVDGSAGCRPR
jgi:S1-C subfamily serine protease